MSGKPIDDGGPAFPVIPAEYEVERSEYGWTIHAADDVLPVGMSLRDYFAIHAPLPVESTLTADLSGTDFGEWVNQQSPNSLGWEFGNNAELRYRFADAMLRARKAGGAA